MFGLGWAEVVVIALVAVFIFGPKKIPELGSTLGKTIRGFKEGIQNSSKDIDYETDKEEI